VTFSNPTTEELLKRAEDLMRQNQEYLEDFFAAMNRLLKRQAEFQAEHPHWGFDIHSRQTDLAGTAI